MDARSTIADAEVAALVQGARSGDAAAMDALLRAVHATVRRWALVATGSADGADEVTQETLIRVFRHLRTFRGGSRFTTWLYRIVGRAAHDWRRRRGRMPRPVPDAAERLDRQAEVAPRGSDPGEALDRRRTLELVARFLGELPPRQREVFDLVELQGLSGPEVAERLGVAPATVRVLLLKARRGIRRRILEQSPELVEDR